MELVVTTPEAFFKRFRGETRDENGPGDGSRRPFAMGQRSIEKVRSPSGGGRPQADRADHQEQCQERQTGCADTGAVAAGRCASFVTPRASSGKTADGFDGDPDAG